MVRKISEKAGIATPTDLKLALAGAKLETQVREYWWPSDGQKTSIPIH